MTSAFAHELKSSALKVAYIYNIAKFTNWPESTWSNASDPFHLCFYGDDQVSEEFIQLKDKQINGHRIELVKVQSNDDYKNCHIFYIDTAERRRYRYLLSLIDQHSVLVVTDNSPFFRVWYWLSTLNPHFQNVFHHLFLIWGFNSCKKEKWMRCFTIWNRLILKVNY